MRILRFCKRVTLAVGRVVVSRPVARPLAGKIGSLIASRVLKRPIRIFYDQSWLRQDGKAVVAMSDHFPLKKSEFNAWLPEGADVIDAGMNYWFVLYGIKPGDLVIDIGAGRGEDTLLFGRMVGEKGGVFSFEAHPKTFAVLRKVTEYSGLRNVNLVHGALFSKSATLQIECRADKNWQENSVMIEGKGGANNVFQPVPAFALDDFEPLQAYDTIDFLKMNIEGAEVEALLGMKKTLAKVKHACIACHDFLSDSNPMMKTRERCKEILLAAGFDVTEMGDNVPPWQRDHLHVVNRSLVASH